MEVLIKATTKEQGIVKFNNLFPGNKINSMLVNSTGDGYYIYSVNFSPKSSGVVGSATSTLQSTRIMRDKAVMSYSSFVDELKKWRRKK